MDRNFVPFDVIRPAIVALRKESVDRNANPGSTTLTFPGSLSARRAWIEILSAVLTELLILSLSARRAWIEISSLDDILAGVKSLSARRAWIEIASSREKRKHPEVALRKESVDRNLSLSSFVLASLCRSPQGERG